MKKLLCLIFISIFLFSCKSNEDPKPTLAERTGTYEGGGYTLVIKSSGETQVVDTEKLSHKTTLDKASSATSFDVDSFKIDFSNGVKINTAELTKKSDSQTFLLTLGERAGVYKGSVTVNNGATTYYSKLEVKATGEILVNAVPNNPNPTPLTSTPSFNPDSTETSFNITTSDSSEWSIAFTSDNALTLKSITGNLELGTLTKQ